MPFSMIFFAINTKYNFVIAVNFLDKKTNLNSTKKNEEEHFTQQSIRIQLIFVQLLEQKHLKKI